MFTILQMQSIDDIILAILLISFLCLVRIRYLDSTFWWHGFTAPCWRSFLYFILFPTSQCHEYVSWSKL